jgi:hypothetical protein
MKHAIIVRAKFEDDKLFKNYLDVARQTFFPSINYQTDKNFTLFLIMESRHRPLINLIVNPNINLIFLDSIGHGKEYFSKNFYEIQTRHDFDDWMKKDYVQKIRAEWYAHRENSIVENLLIQSQPYLHVLKTRRILPMNTRYSNKFVSMHLSLCQKTNKNYIYEHYHHKMNKVSQNIKLLPNGYTRLVIHRNNKLSNIHS